MKLNIVEQLKTHGLDYVVDKFKLKLKDYGHKFLLKYDQLNSPSKNASVMECRGIILDKEFNVISLPFIRFFNYDQHTRKNIDWNTARIFEKQDGTAIQLYFDPYKDGWCVGTFGAAETTDPVSLMNKYTGEKVDYDFTFGELFWKVSNFDKSFLNKDYNYIFELSTEYNQVVNKYDDSKLSLIGSRNCKTFEEVSQTELDEIANLFNCDRPKEYFFSSEEEMVESLKKVKYGDTNFEGYVVVDDNFNRLKVKSNTYIIHSQFNGDITSKWRLVDVVLNNEIEEVLAYFPSLDKDLLKLKYNYERKILAHKELFDEVVSKEWEKKDFYIFMQTKGLDKFLFKIFAEGLKGESFETIINELDKKKLYKFLK